MSLKIDCTFEDREIVFSGGFKESKDNFHGDFEETGGSAALLPATRNRLGGIIIGAGITVTGDGVASVDMVDTVDDTINKPVTSAGVANSYLTNMEIEELLK